MADVVPLPTPSSPNLGDLRGLLLRRLRRAWPTSPAELLEDAAQQALVALWERSDAGPMVSPEGFAWRVAWRAVRGGWRDDRRRAAAVEPGRDPWRAVDLRLDLERRLGAHLAAFPPERRAPLRRALHARADGLDDGEAAEAHGVPREYLNRLRGSLRRELVAA